MHTTCLETVLHVEILLFLQVRGSLHVLVLQSTMHYQANFQHQRDVVNSLSLEDVPSSLIQ